MENSQTPPNVLCGPCFFDVDQQFDARLIPRPVLASPALSSRRLEPLWPLTPVALKTHGSGIVVAPVGSPLFGACRCWAVKMTCRPDR
jgi:hypothetical protein